MGFLKKALKREDDGTPVGFPGKMYLDCVCGNHLSMPSGVSPVTCKCGTVYDGRGFILKYVPKNSPSTPCTAGTMTFGGECLNCGGINAHAPQPGRSSR